MDNKNYFWRVTLVDDECHVSFAKSGLTWEEASKMMRKYAGDVTSFRLDREGLIDG